MDTGMVSNSLSLSLLLLEKELAVGLCPEKEPTDVVFLLYIRSGFGSCMLINTIFPVKALGGGGGGL